MGPNSWSQPDMLCANAASAGGRDAGRGGRSDAAPSARGVADGFRFSSVGLGRVLAAEVSAGSVGRGLSAGFSLTEFSLLSGFSLPPAAQETARERWRGRSSSLWSDARASAATDARDRFAGAADALGVGALLRARPDDSARRGASPLGASSALLSSDPVSNASIVSAGHVTGT